MRALIFLALLPLAGCVSGSGAPNTSVAAANNTGISDLPIKIGEPYVVDGQRYVPEDIADYDEIGYASWYGQELGGKLTANGETFRPTAITAAHKTLPLPSYVEITAIETGRTIVARINDRGPFANDRIIDLSRGAAEQLGIVDQGVAGVRVRRVNPPLAERALLRQGLRIAERPVTPDSLLIIMRDRLAKLQNPRLAARPITNEQPDLAQTSSVQTPEAANADTQNVVQYIVQIAAFSSKARADNLASQLNANVFAAPEGNIWRVRYGPYNSNSEAQTALAKARTSGYPDARILRR